MDPQSRHAVWDLVRELRDDGVAVVLTTHLMDEAEDLADQVVVVDHGRVIAQGSVPSLLASADDRTLRLETTPRARPRAPRSGAGFVVTEPPRRRLHRDRRGRPATRRRAHRAGSPSGTCWSRSLTVGRRTLEDVFLDLTGRSLR